MARTCLVITNEGKPLLLSIKKLLVVSLTLLVVSCANIPIATMLEFRSFDEEKFVELDPNHLLTKIHLDKPAEIKPESTWLTLGVSSSDQERSFKYNLEVISEKTLPAESGWLSKTPARTEYILGLSAEAIKEFTELQEFMGSASPTGFDLHVNTGFKEAANEMTSITMSIFLKLYADEDYFTLIDRAELDIEKGSE